MSFVYLDSKAAITAAIATMPPVASEASQLLAHRIFENPAMLDNEDLLAREHLQACAVSFGRTGGSIVSNRPQFEAFLENHGHAVFNVAVSIVLFSVKDSKQKRVWGWIGKAAGVAAGVGLGAFFG